MFTPWLVACATKEGPDSGPSFVADSHILIFTVQCLPTPCHFAVKVVLVEPFNV